MYLGEKLGGQTSGTDPTSPILRELEKGSSSPHAASVVRRMDPHPSFTATWRIVLAILASSQNFGLRKPKF
jgi:hypothetical protein